eukprot:TRINITY_DN14725_c0_g1_i1.p1 TRINITY_DN14725_c0_g1~~TRINITY_DN14725_c0_g1_i1.p1  ORF type:complete len:218 (+),score=25.22 TRINITY_DN14725_c0_g1_i1:89-742(+)
MLISEQFVLGRGGAVLGAIGIALLVTGMSLKEWCVWEAEDWLSLSECAYTETACGYWNMCVTTGTQCEEALQEGIRYQALSVGLWGDDDDHNIVKACKAFSVLSVIFGGFITLNRACAASGDAQNPLMYVPPPCPTCMLAVILTFLFLLATLVLYTARAVSTYSGALREGYFVFLSGSLLVFCLIATTVASHYTTHRDHVLWGGHNGDDEDDKTQPY